MNWDETLEAERERERVFIPCGFAGVGEVYRVHHCAKSLHTFMFSRSSNNPSLHPVVVELVHVFPVVRGN